VTPLPDQDVIHLDIARAKICSKIDLSDAYKQICIIPEDVHKNSVSNDLWNIHEQRNATGRLQCAPQCFQCTMNSIFHEYIRIFLHTYLDDLFIYSKLGARAPENT